MDYKRGLLRSESMCLCCVDEVCDSDDLSLYPINALYIYKNENNRLSENPGYDSASNSTVVDFVNGLSHVHITVSSYSSANQSCSD